MPDFGALLNAPAGVAPKPKALPMGNYPGVIRSHELVAAPEGKNYKTIIRFHVNLTGWADNVSEADKVEPDGLGGTRPIDPTKRQLRRDFYDSQMFRLDDFIKSCGVVANGRTYAEVLPELTGARVICGVEPYISQKTGDEGNQINAITGAQ